MQTRLDQGNLPVKEIDRAKKNNKAEFPDGIPECGSDALRFGLLAYTVQGRDVNLDIKRVVGYRNFCNKLWNATRFALQFVSDFKPTPNLMDDLMTSQKMAIRDKFIISRLMHCCDKVNECFTDYRFGDAQMTAYSFWIDDLCDVYLELVKPVVYDKSESNASSRWAAQATLWISIETGLRILHPMMPFVTEELWQRLPGRGTLGPKETASIMIADFPECIPQYVDTEKEASMEITKNIIKACRSLRSTYNIANKVLTSFFIKTSPSNQEIISLQTDDIITLGKASSIQINPTTEIPQNVGIFIVDDNTTVSMDLTGLIDYDVEIAKLGKTLSKTKPLRDNIEKKINAPGYRENVSKELAVANDEKLVGLNKKVEELTLAIEKMMKLKNLQ